MFVCMYVYALYVYVCLSFSFAYYEFFLEPDVNEIPVVYSADWTTWIIAQPHSAESTVEVKFGFPEKLSWADNASFTEYLIQLVDDQNRVSDKTTYIRPYNSGSVAVAVHNFTGVSSGRYRVQVQPKDTLKEDRDRCQCWKKGSLGIRDCQPCKTTETKTFNFTSTWRSTSTASTTSTTVNEKPTSAASMGTPESLGRPDASVIVLAVIIPVVLVALLIAGICCWKQRKAGGKAGLKLDRNENKVNRFGNVFRKFDTLVPGMGKELKVPQVTRKTVLLLASEDHKYFSQALNNFSTFLTLHCQCDVMFAPEQLADVRKTANSYCWLSGKIDQADVVIIVTSQAACRQYQAFQKGQVYKEADLGPEGDLFTPGIKHICGKIASGEDVSKVMMVRFEHTASEHRLPISALPPSFYLLPTRLKSCLLHIHGLDENNMNLSTVNLPLQGNVQELQGGKEWLNAVSEAMAFECEHPAWFEEKFGRLVDTSGKDKPDYDTQVSGVSEESGFFEGRNSGILQRRLSSVSTHAHKAPCEFVPDGLENPSFVFSKSDFIAPSEFEAQSAYTVPYSAYTERERPPEVDQGSTLSDQFRVMNERYEQDRMQELFQPQGSQNIPEEERSAISDQTGYPLVHENLGYPGQNAYYIQFQHPGNEEDRDCISVSSAQSV
ncbi:uncharacterized protein [Littorina saxatilis]|uniref:uncharacterized protein n=1 Tax=Littorina saxatilis TaxID=31220 RepID=UPI0038B4918B